MKGKSLLKKIAAAATTVAMLASVSVVGFAETDGIVDDKAPGETINGRVYATDIEVTPKTNSFGFTVTYNTDVESNSIGYTMLAYKANVIAAYPDNGNGSDVVGIAQNTTAAGKTFTFDVAKGDDARAVDYGDSVVILLSSDAAAGAVGYLKKITGTTDKVVVNDTEFAVELPYYDASDAAKVKAELEEVDNLNVNVTIGEGTTEDVNAVGVTEVGTPVYADNAWSVEVTLAEIVGNSLSVTAGKKVTIPIDVTKEVWTATSATMANDVIPYDAENEITEVAAMLTTITNLVKDGSHSITFTGADGHTVVQAVPATATVDWKGDAPATIEQGGEYTVTVTLAEVLTLDDEVATAPQDLAADFTITYQTDTRKEITGAAAYKDTTKVEALADYDISKGAAASNVIAYVETLINKYEITDGTATAAGKKTAIALYNEAGTDTVETVAKDETYTVKITVEADDAVKVDWKGSFVIALSIDVVEAPAWACGDVDHQYGVTPLDATWILKYAVGDEDAQFVADRISEADVDRLYGITPLDATWILKYSVGDIDSLPVE